MKRRGFICAALAAAIVSAGVLSGGLTVKAAGNWENTDEGWKYKKDSGDYAYDEFVEGWWINSNGIQVGSDQASWHQDSGGWWYGDSSGWYACDNTYVIDDVTYVFNKDGYKATTGWIEHDGKWRYHYEDAKYACDEYKDGCYIDVDGYWDPQFEYSWYKDDHGWYYMDKSGDYLAGRTAVIDSYQYYFDSKGYAVEFTHLIPSAKKTNAVIKSDLKRKNDAADQLNSIFTGLVSDGSSLKCMVDGEPATIKNKNENIYINNKKLSDYIGKSKKSIEIEVNMLPAEIFKSIFSMNFSSIGESDYEIEFGGVNLSGFYHEDGFMAFNVNGKKHRACIDFKVYDQNPEVIVLGREDKSDWIKKLKTSGVIKDKIDVRF